MCDVHIKLTLRQNQNIVKYMCVCINGYILNLCRYANASDDRRLVCERPDVITQRVRYLRQVKNLREEGFHMVWLDETWCNQSHTVSKRWSDAGPSTDHQCVPPSGKGKRLIILHAGGDSGFVDSAGLVFVGNTKSSDYHDEMNSRHFNEWFK